ncbi:helix-turn-helix transcriptional regulator [Lysinibacillus sp. NPDC097279]|uniref:helix-turn-helix transcriptional regulator n=1 Tax=unclassified Lysinibacillus TaxID=2636778 RepID=UPI00193671F3|nr:YafY family transcriptional regulator [Lysinibacillus sp. JNUCC-52]
MSKMVNMLSILWLLKTRKQLTAKELAEELEISIRTVYRYIDALCASGVPIISDAGHNGGYSLLNEFTKAPLFFNQDEQKALVHAAKFAIDAGYPFSETLDEAISKLKMYTNEEQLNHINNHLRGFEVIHPTVAPSLKSILQDLEMAVADSYSVNIVYLKEREIEPQSRYIDPYGIVYWKSKWYTVAYCHLRKEVRSFRMDRIQSLSKTDQKFDRPFGFSARSYFLKDLLPDSNQLDKLVSVRIEGNAHVLDDLCQHWLFNHALIERKNNQALFKVDKESIHSFVPYFLLPYGKSLTILEPTLLQEQLATISFEIFKHYQNTSLH